MTNNYHRFQKNHHILNVDENQRWNREILIRDCSERTNQRVRKIVIRNFDSSDGDRSSFFIKNINTRCPCTKTIKVLLGFEGFDLFLFSVPSGDSDVPTSSITVRHGSKWGLGSTRHLEIESKDPLTRSAATLIKQT